jgi:hypothetical protein
MSNASLDTVDTPAVPNTVTEADTPDTVEGTDPSPAETDESDDNTGREAAKWRKKLRGAEAERDDLATRLEAVQRQQIEKILVAAHVKPPAVWAVAELGDLLADDGTIDAAAVEVAITAAREQFGITPISTGNYVPGIGSGNLRAPRRLDQWTEAFKPQKR